MHDPRPRAPEPPPRAPEPSLHVALERTRSVSQPHRWREILAIRLDNVGDVVMLGPSLRALRAAAPAARLTLLASPAGAAAAELLPSVDDVIVERAPWQDASGRAPDPGVVGDLVARLRERDFDAAFVFTSFSQTAWPPAFAAYLAGIPFRAGQAHDFGGSLLTRVVAPLPYDTHQVDRNAHLLEGVGIPVLDRRLEIRIPATAGRSAASLRSEAGLGPSDPYLLVAPAASCAARSVTPERIAPGVVRLAGESGLPVLVVGSARDIPLADAVAASIPGSTSLAGRTTLPELAALVRDTTLLVTAHSAPMHLADATGTPMVVAFSGTDLESHWRPRRSPAVLLRRDTVCAPCHRFDCPYDTACLDIDPADVATAGSALLASAGATRPTRASDPGRVVPVDQKEHDEWIACAS